MAQTDGRSAEKPEAIVQLRRVEKRFPVGDKQVTVLSSVSFEMQPGEFLAVVGPSGNGKSTLLNMVTGIDHPSAGEVVVAGHAVHEMNENELALWRGEHVGIIFQFFQLLPALTLHKNVILPMDLAGRIPPAQRSVRAMELLDLVGLADHAHKLPRSVSGGEQQRGAIARALANDPPLIVADEPTGNLDVQTSEEVFDLFNRLVGQGKTVIMVTHSRSLASRIPRVIELRNGRVQSDSQSDGNLAGEPPAGRLLAVDPDH